jgi:hypothetical protein
MVVKGEKGKRMVGVGGVGGGIMKRYMNALVTDFDQTSGELRFLTFYSQTDLHCYVHYTLYARQIGQTGHGMATSTTTTPKSTSKARSWSGTSHTWVILPNPRKTMGDVFHRRFP